ncbi:hypothetical protein ACFUIY_37630 [Streptomyces griseorubiginosus]|uniref:hypothetical protein n=1 Tax=Streptomyces griseorubiginosus TaxID=67304 RepID=UPI003638CF72
MSQHFESEAVLVIDGAEFPVKATITVDTGGSLKEWYGTVTADEPGLAFRLVSADRALLRMPNGNEGPIVPGGRDSTTGIAFQGSGPAPCSNRP